MTERVVGHGAAPALLTERLRDRQTCVTTPHRSSTIQLDFAIEARTPPSSGQLRRNAMLKRLAAIGLGAALVLAPVVSFAQTDSPTPAATETPMAKKVVHHKVHKAKHVVKKPVAHKMSHKVKKPKPKPTPKPTETPKS
jgi:hypothetical protein